MSHQYRKHFTPLESNPSLFTSLAHTIGLSPALEFHDVLSLHDADLLSLTPRPAHALIIVFPTSPNYEAELTTKDKDITQYTSSGDNEPIIWYKQTINNACGLYAILHAVSNGHARDFIIPNSHLYQLLTTCTPLNPRDRAAFLENDTNLEAAYKTVALQGDSAVPENPEDEVDFHYVCFVRSPKNGHLYELDGDTNGPINLGKFEEDDLLSERGLRVLKEFIEKTECEGGVSLLALAPAE